MKYPLFIITVFLSSVFLIAGCKSTQQTVAPKKQEAETNVMESPFTAPPSSCNIRAKIVSITPAQLKPGSQDPCANNPCRAKVKVEEVFACGQGVSRTISAGETLEILFTLTLGPVDNSKIPGLKVNLPGLTEGDSFTANVRITPEFGSRYSYQISVYEKN